MSLKKWLWQAAEWVVPFRPWILLVEALTPKKPPDEREMVPRHLTSRNARYRNLHRGQRCFIMGNGPSVARQDIRALKREFVFSVSSGYLHPHFRELERVYHCVPQVTYAKLGMAGVVRWFREMDAMLERAPLFLSTQEAALVESENLFRSREVNYLCFRGETKAEASSYDICEPVPGVQSVTVMALLIAIYMGFKEIYLLGVENDSFRTRRYEYFYSPTVLRGMDTFVEADGAVTQPLAEELRSYARLFDQYAHLHRVALKNGVKIFNATEGGAVEEFPRVRLEQVVSRTANAASGP